MAKSPITCHVLDAALGKPAQGVVVSLQIVDQSNGAPSFREIGSSVTNSDGRCLDLLPPRGSEDAAKRGIALESGQNYKVIFQTKTYFEQSGRVSFYPWVEIPFTIQNPEEHYHIPLLISPFSFTTYRGS